jgi:hypothetical protein
MKIRALKNVAQILATLNKYCNLKTSKMGKIWHFIFAIVYKLKKLSCYSKYTKIKHKIKYSLSRATKTKTKK